MLTLIMNAQFQVTGLILFLDVGGWPSAPPTISLAMGTYAEKVGGNRPV